MRLRVQREERVELEVQSVERERHSWSLKGED